MDTDASTEQLEADLFPDERKIHGKAEQLQLQAPIRHTGRYLSRDEILLLQEYLTIYLSLPFIMDLNGEAAEQIIALARGATHLGKRANRPEPDIIFNGLNYSIKTEKMSGSVPAVRRLGTKEDIITARLPIGNISGMMPDEIGTMVLEAYNRDIIDKYQWHKIGILFRFMENTQFIYFDEEAVHYNPSDYRWDWVTRGSNTSDRNILAIRKSTNRQAFRWNFGTTLLYVYHDIPSDADVFSIRKQSLDIETLRQLLFNAE